MRKFIIKHFALNYIFKAFGRIVDFPRAANIIWTLFLLNGVVSILTKTYPIETWYGIVLLILLLISIFFGFVYFRIYPAKWHELDIHQKWQRGFYKVTPLTDKQKSEWLVINQMIYKDWNSAKFKNVSIIIYNIAVTIIAILILIFK
jgi:hypothetical protein